jgi:hypothetical protein
MNSADESFLNPKLKAMFADPNNPFAAAAPESGSVPSPFKPGSSGTPPHQTSDSPFGVAPSSARQAEPAQTAASPFSMVDKVSQPRIAEPSEGFAALDHEPVREASPPVPMPQLGANVRGSFDTPAVQEMPGSDFVLPAERSAPQEFKDRRVVGSSGQTPPVATYSQPLNMAQSPHNTPQVSVHGDMPQLVLRAIFGVTQELNKNEIIQRARNLPGIHDLHLVSSDEAKAMSYIRSSIQRMGFGDHNSVTLHTDAGVVDLIEEPGATLAVLYEGDYKAGVRETLIIVARELARLS